LDARIRILSNEVNTTDSVEIFSEFSSLPEGFEIFSEDGGFEFGGRKRCVSEVDKSCGGSETYMMRHGL
jgi:hypothetical protein